MRYFTVFTLQLPNVTSLLKRRQIRNSRPCAIATAQLLLRVVAASRTRDATTLIDRIRKVGQRLIAAQPREMAVGNIVRRVLGLIREVEEDEAADDIDTPGMSESGTLSPPSHNDSLHRPGLSSHISTFSPLRHGAAIPQDVPLRPESSGTSSMSDSIEALEPSKRPPLFASHTSGPGVTSLFGLLSHPDEASPIATPPPGTQSPTPKSIATPRNIASLPDSRSSNIDVKAEVIDGIKELLDELEQVDDQIASSALDHIHENELILTHTSSQTVQRFLLAAARKRKFTVIHAEAYPNDHIATHATVLHGHSKNVDEDDEPEDRWKPLRALGITVILIPDTAIFALMSRVNKVLLSPHTVLANGGLVAAAGALGIAQAAKHHKTPVVCVSGVFKLSPIYPFDTDELIEYGDPSVVVPYEDGAAVEGIEVVNPIFDYVSPDLVDLYITNL